MGGEMGQNTKMTENIRQNRQMPALCKCLQKREVEIVTKFFAGSLHSKR